MSINEFLKQSGFNILQEIENFGLVTSNKQSTLTYVCDEKYINEVNQNPNIVVVLCKKQFEGLIKKKCIVVNNPLIFYVLFNEYQNNYIKSSTIIKNKDLVSKKSYISEFNVFIGENTVIHPNVTILSDVRIGDNCIVKPGAVIGGDGAEYKNIDGEVISIKHDGKVIIGNNVSIGSNTCIDKGLFGDTIVSDNVKIDNLCHIAHNVKIKDNTYVLANSTICGSTLVKNNCWISPSSTIINGITIEKNNKIGLGSTQFRSTKEDEVYLGNPSRKVSL